MTEPYTPDTAQIHRDYAAHRNENMFSPTVAKAREFRESGGGEGEFDRWLRKHDVDVIAASRAVSSTSSRNARTCVAGAYDALVDALDLNMTKIMLGRGVNQPVKLKGKLQKVLALLDAALHSMPVIEETRSCTG